MSGSLGMVASTLPVQALLPLLGWRGLFLVVAAASRRRSVLIAGHHCRLTASRVRQPRAHGGYSSIFRHPVFVRSSPLRSSAMAA